MDSQTHAIHQRYVQWLAKMKPETTADHEYRCLAEPSRHPFYGNLLWPPDPLSYSGVDCRTGKKWRVGAITSPNLSLRYWPRTLQSPRDREQDPSPPNASGPCCQSSVAGNDRLATKGHEGTRLGNERAYWCSRSLHPEEAVYYTRTHGI
jgi:hypothetical protein